MKNFWIVFCLLFCVGIIESIQAQVVSDGSYDDEESGDEEFDHLFSKIDCKVGDKHDYVMATQSSLLQDNKENFQIKAKIELECLQKVDWLNETSGRMKPGQIFAARIVKMEPKRINITGSENGQLQMAALFDNLQNLETANGGNPTDGPKNIKLGAVNGFFAELSTRFGRWLAEVFQKLLKFIQKYTNKKRTSAVPVNFSFQCTEVNNSDGNGGTRRPKRESPMVINLEQFADNYTELFKNPFQFIQLEDGSIQNVQVSKLDKDPNVIQYKKFIARAFATQLDERKKVVLEKSELGTHYCHYQMEYDEPEAKKFNPEQYITRKYRNKRSPDDQSHMVSVMRRFKKEDIIKEDNNEKPRKNIGVRQLDFNVQEVQLIRKNMVVASGGYFQGFLADEPLAKQNRKRRGQAFREAVFDEFLQKHLDLNLQYSMVKLDDDDDYEPIRRKKRSLDSGSTINYGDKIVKLLFSNVNDIIGGPKRFKRDSSDVTSYSTNGGAGFPNKVVCQKVSQPYDDLSPKDNNIGKEIEYRVADDVDGKYVECYEYKKFGSDMLNVYFNTTLLTKNSNGKDDGDKSIKDDFQTKYNVGARFFNVDLFVGRINLAKFKDQARLTLNLFGSEYVDLNLCQIKDKVFSQSDSIPLYVEDIWFITNVGLKIKYKLNFKIDIPDLNCEGEKNSGNNQILSKTINEQLEINQKTNLEFGAVVEASFLILNGQLRLNGNFDMDSLVDFNGSCVAARSHVKPMNVGVDFNYEFFHPVCNQWMQDQWRPKPLSWNLNKEYRNSWFPNTCI